MESRPHGDRTSRPRLDDLRKNTFAGKVTTPLLKGCRGGCREVLGVGWNDLFRPIGEVQKNGEHFPNEPLLGRQHCLRLVLARWLAAGPAKLDRNEGAVSGWVRWAPSPSRSGNSVDRWRGHARHFSPVASRCRRLVLYGERSIRCPDPLGSPHFRKRRA